MKLNIKFASCRLDPILFTHEAHLRLAWLNIHEYGLNEAEFWVSEQLKAYTAHLGQGDKYNHTLTIAAVKAVNHFMQNSNTDNFKDFIAENSRLKTHFKELLSQHYSTNIFRSKKARKVFLEPELAGF